MCTNDSMYKLEIKDYNRKPSTQYWCMEIDGTLGIYKNHTEFQL